MENKIMSFLKFSPVLSSVIRSWVLFKVQSVNPFHRVPYECHISTSWANLDYRSTSEILEPFSFYRVLKFLIISVVNNRGCTKSNNRV